MTPARPCRKPSGQPATSAAQPRHQNSCSGGVHIDIQRLSLHGYTQAQQRRFIQALEVAIRSFASEQARWSLVRPMHIAHLDAIHPGAGANPEESARQLAQQLFGKLGGSQRERRHG